VLVFHIQIRVNKLWSQTTANQHYENIVLRVQDSYFELNLVKLIMYANFWD